MEHYLIRSQRRQWFTGLLTLSLLWIVFALWQWTEHRSQSLLIQDNLNSQASALAQAIRSSLQSHRWLGPFVQQQLPESLSVLAGADNVIALALLVQAEPEQVFLSGNAEAIDLSLAPGSQVRGNQLQLVSEFPFNNVPPPMHGFATDSQVSSNSIAIRSFVLLDRTETQLQLQRETRNRLITFSMGTALLLAAGAGWLATVRLAQAEGKAKLLTAETRHLRELGQAAAGLAHETRNPLGLIRGWTQRLVDSGLNNQEQQQQAESVLEECDRVTARINQFLAFARQAELQVEPVLLSHLLDMLFPLLQSDLKERNVGFDTQQIQDQQPILADPGQLRQILFNLVQNALEFAPQGSTITMQLVRSSEGKRRLEVADEGPGVSPDIVDSVFDPYVSQRAGGTGLGLSIVRRIALAHGWEVGYHPREGGGSVFWIDGIRPA